MGWRRLASRKWRMRAAPPPCWCFPRVSIPSASGSVIADLHVQLWRAVQENDLAAARRVNDRIWPTAEAFYSEPSVDMHNRMKEALVLLGKLPRAVVRPPLVKLPQAEIERIRTALIAAGLLKPGAAPRFAALR